MLEYIVLFSAGVFIVRSLFFFGGLIRESARNRCASFPEQLPFVSVLIPARDEEANIRECLSSLTQNDYPVDKFEIIVIDDCSSDATPGILEEMKAEIPNLRIITIRDESKEKELRGKPGAIQAGADAARGEILLMSDADCVFSSGWIRKMTSYYDNPEVKLVASFTNIISRRVFDRFQEVEWLYMHTMARAGVGMGLPFGCYGNNLSVRRKDFEEIGGYKRIKFNITEDLALLQAFTSVGKKARYVTHPLATVRTKPCPTVKDYMRQRHRWTNGGVELGMKAVLFVITSVSLWSGIAASFVSGVPEYALALFGVRVVCDGALITHSFFRLKLFSLLPWIVPSVAFFMLLELIVPFMLLDRNVVWKGRIFDMKAQ